MIVRIGEAVIDCAVATTPEEFSIGLSETPSLEPGHGMLFACPVTMADKKWSFWMPPKMKFALDIIFISLDGRVSIIHENCQPGDKRYFTGTGRWILEVPARFCNSMSIHRSDKVEFEEEKEHEAMQSSDVLRTLSTAKKASYADENEWEITDRNGGRGIIRAARKNYGSLPQYECWHGRVYMRPFDAWFAWELCRPDGSVFDSGKVTYARWGFDEDGTNRLEECANAVDEAMEDCDEAFKDLIKNASKKAYTEAYNDRTLTVRGSKEAMDVIARMLEWIKAASAGGHSFDVVCDEQTAKEPGKFGIDGDGAFRIKSIELSAPTRSKSAQSVSPQDISLRPTHRLMKVREFVELGLLQEVNRRLLHPMGLALSVAIPDDGGDWAFNDAVYDCRLDPEGMIFAEEMLTQEFIQKYIRVETLFLAKKAAREAKFLTHIQGVPTSPVVGMPETVTELMPVGMDQIAQSTETEPYQRAPSIAPGTPSQERKLDQDSFDNQISDGGVKVEEGPVHDEQWNSPTRGA